MAWTNAFQERGKRKEKVKWAFIVIYRDFLTVVPFLDMTYIFLLFLPVSLLFLPIHSCEQQLSLISALTVIKICFS